MSAITITVPRLRATACSATGKQLIALWRSLYASALLILVAGASAGQAREFPFGDYVAHISAFNSGFISPDTAKIYNIERSGKVGLINISVLKGDRPVKASVKVVVTNLMTQKRTVPARLIEEGQALYYLATFPHSNEETLRFSVEIEPEHRSERKRIEFSQKFYSDVR